MCLSNGTIAGSVVPMNKGFQNLVRKVGISLHDAVKMAAVNPTKVLSFFSRIGPLESSKDASIVILDEDVRVPLTM